MSIAKPNKQNLSNALPQNISQPKSQNTTKAQTPQTISQNTGANPLSNRLQKNLRLKAEWEKQDSILLSFPHAKSDWAGKIDEARECFVDIIRAISEFEKVIICVDTHDFDGFLYLQKAFGKSSGITNRNDFEKLKTFDLNEKITLVFMRTNDTWARDFGAITLELDFDKKNSLQARSLQTHSLQTQLIDFVFNGWGGKYRADFDNQINQNLAKAGIFTYPLTSLDFVLEGGSIDTDGAGTILTTSACLLEKHRNPHLNKAQIESKLKEYLGVSRVLWVDFGYLRGDDTDSHIDMLARFIDSSTIAYIGCDDVADEHYEELSKMQAQLESFRQENGEPYNLVRLPFVGAIYDENNERLPASYANFLFVNGGLLVPIYDDKNDKKALEILANALPHLRVVGVNARTLIKWHGSLHCISMQLY